MNLIRAVALSALIVTGVLAASPVLPGLSVVGNASALPQCKFYGEINPGQPVEWGVNCVLSLARTSAA